MIRRILLYLGFYMIIMLGVVSAQSIPMTVDLYQPTQFPKSDGPVSFVWQCSVSSTELLEGHFFVSAHDGNEKYGQFRSHDVALQSGFHEIPMVLPPFNVTNPYGELKLKLSFITKNNRYDFKEEYALHVGRRFQRTFAVGVCDPFDVQLSPNIKKFLDKLKFESISPEEPIALDKDLINSYFPNRNLFNNQKISLDVNTVSIHIPPPEFPQIPIDCHQYDLLVITARGLNLLESRHLKAIRQWVRSGGSLCIIAGMTPGQLPIQFLNNLIENKTNSPFLINSEGNLKFDQSMQIWFQRTGWGRAVVVLENALDENALSSNEMSRIPFFLWKLKESQKVYYQKEDKWDHHTLVKSFLKTQKQTNYNNLNAYSINELLSLNYRPIFTGGAVVTSLMPAEMRVVPSWIIMAVLLGYVLIIGPGEYFILGKLRIRRFTWITFPLISIGFALIAFMLSDYFMQTSYERKVLAIYDLDAQGEPVKENKIELIFTGSYQQIETKIKSGLFTPMNHSELGMIPNYNMYARNMSTALVGPPFYSGSIPTQYSVFQLMPQWTPQLNRIVHNYPEELSAPFDWSTIRVEQLKSDLGRQKIHKQIKTAFGNRAQLLVYKGGADGQVKRFPLYQPNDYHPSQIRNSKAYALVNPMLHSYQRYAGHQQTQHSFMDDVCVRNQMGLFQIISQTSPSGGNNYEDLSILDPSDPKQWLVVVYVPGKDQDTIYRQFIVADN
ncbi:MAG: hypothetical protein K0U82_04195 [Planctomycetes bacterium]|nr:hypothetical protein [Planctomycetota bacterium]